MKSKNMEDLKPVYDKDGILIYDPTNDFDPSRKSHYSNEHNERLEKLLKQKGKITWGDVYAPILARREKYKNKKEWSPGLWGIFHTDPNREMMLVIDDSDGKEYWMPEYDFDKKRTRSNKWSKLTKWLRNIFPVMIMMFSSSLPIFAEGFYKPTKPMIIPFVIGVEDINERLGDIGDHTPLYKEGGYVYIPTSYFTHNGYSEGIVVVHSNSGDFFAYDRRCARCWYDEDEKGKIRFVTVLTAECDNCGARVPSMIAWGSGQMDFYDFKQYGHHGPEYLDGYNVKVIRKNKKRYLWITNTLNGNNHEWTSNPKNKIIVDGYRELFGSDWERNF